MPYWFVAPLAVLLLIVNFYPILYSLQLSLSRWPMDRFYEGPTFAGLVNYLELLHSERMWSSVSFVAFYVVASVSLSFLLGMGLALLLDTRLPARAVIRSVVVLPIAMAPLVVALTWRQLMDADFGVINFFISLAGGPHLTWLSTLPWAQFAIVIVDVWQQVPFVGIVLLAGLQAIPDEYYEAARIDGGNAWRLFRSITLPLLRPAILVAGVILTTNAVRMFDLSYALTLGGPYASTETLSFFAFDRAFQAFDLPLAAAVSWFVFAVNLLITFIFVRVLHVRIDL
ncbi:MAG: sugar ABC transporter permease [Chloroflexi bacterium]|nr:sugar ABC transporter permease [Chloroflexota bacterium]